MPGSQLKYKAGKLSFLLVCLFLCFGCGTEKAVFYAGMENQSQTVLEETVEKYPTEDAKEVEKENPEPELININTAEKEELMMLPGIGEVRAAAIIEYRQRAGSFEKIEDIMNVKGIKNGIFSKICDLICVK